MFRSTDLRRADGTLIGRPGRVSNVAVHARSPMEAAMSVTTQEPTHHPVVIEHRERRASDLQLRVADTITKFAGSMRFVYVHIVLFVAWMLVVEKNPWPTLTLGVSLEAIFLSTFVMIGQNRQAEFAQRKADHDFTEQEQELKLNTQLTQAIHTLAQEIHNNVCGPQAPPATRS
jgi:uncharacterized membrane protein